MPIKLNLRFERIKIRIKWAIHKFGFYRLTSKKLIVM